MFRPVDQQDAQDLERVWAQLAPLVLHMCEVQPKSTHVTSTRVLTKRFGVRLAAAFRKNDVVRVLGRLRVRDGGSVERAIGASGDWPPPRPVRVDSESRRVRNMAELQRLAQGLQHVSNQWVQEVSSLEADEMRRRLIRLHDWFNHFSRSLDNITEIQGLPGSGVDGYRSHKEVRAVVLALLQQIEQLKAPGHQSDAAAKAKGS